MYFLVGTSESLTATAFDSAGVPMTMPLDFEWYSGDSSVIAVDQDGRITAKKPGFTWVFAKLAKRPSQRFVDSMPSRLESCWKRSLPTLR